MIRLITGIMVICSLLLVKSAHAEPEIWQVLMAEAVDQGYDGMYAVACVMRNRGGGFNGFCGAKRKGLDAWCQKQGKKYTTMAKKIENQVFIKNAPDSTGGATHFEAVERYGEPYWAKSMTITTKIGCHTFYKEK